MSARVKAHLAILTANVLFALNYSYSKSVLGFMSSDALCVARIASAAIVFALISALVVRERIEWRDLGLLALGAMFGIAGNQFVFLRGLALTSPVDASIIATVGPVLVLLISAILGRDRITLLKSIGIAIGASGAVTVILYGGLGGFGAGHLTGNLLVFVAAASYAGYLIVIKQLMGKYSPLTIMAWVFGISALFMTPVLWDDLASTAWGSMTAGGWFAFIFVIVGATWVAYVCVAKSLSRLSPTTVSIYSYTQPVLASVFAIVRGQDTVSWVKIVSALLVFTGVFIVTRSYKVERKA